MKLGKAVVKPFRNPYTCRCADDSVSLGNGIYKG